MSSSRLRLLKVIVQPVFVVDDGEDLTEQYAEPVAVSPAEWPTYATTAFPEAVTRLEARREDEVQAADASRSEEPS